jgi:hypothetical protein
VRATSRARAPDPSIHRLLLPAVLRGHSMPTHACMHTRGGVQLFETRQLVLLGRPLVPPGRVASPASPSSPAASARSFILWVVSRCGAAAAPLLNLVNLSLPEINRSQESLCELPRSHSMAYHIHRHLPGRPAGQKTQPLLPAMLELEVYYKPCPPRPAAPRCAASMQVGSGPRSPTATSPLSCGRPACPTTVLWTCHMYTHVTVYYAETETADSKHASARILV